MSRNSMFNCLTFINASIYANNQKILCHRFMNHTIFREKTLTLTSINFKITMKNQK